MTPEKSLQFGQGRMDIRIRYMDKLKKNADLIVTRLCFRY